MISSTCKAKDPNSCRYHHPGADYVALRSVKNAQDRYDMALNLDDKSKAHRELQEAKSVYDATDGGYKQLRNDLREARGSLDNSSVYQELLLRVTKAKLARVEEKQKGAATDTIFLETPEMKQHLREMKKHVFSANTDHFIDTFDNFESSLTKAAESNDSFKFANTYNALVEELEIKANETSWIKPEEGNQWKTVLENMKFKGKIYKNLIGINDMTKSSTFEL